MGYTRYWKRPQELDQKRFANFSVDCIRECELLELPLEDTLFTAELVTFKGSPGCETFRIERISSGRVRDGAVFEFCKTAHLPYDQAVDCCLKLLKKHFPEVEIPPPS